MPPRPTPKHLRLTAMSVRRAVNGNPTVVDFGRLPWAIIIGANSTLELRDLIIHSYAPRSSASNTSHYYVGGLVSWPSISMAPSGVLKRCVAPAAHLPALRVRSSASQCHPWRSLSGSVRRAQNIDTSTAPPWFMLAGRACHAFIRSGQHQLRKASAHLNACICCSAAGTTRRSTSGAPHGIRAATASGSLRLRCPERRTL